MSTTSLTSNSKSSTIHAVDQALQRIGGLKVRIDDYAIKALDATQAYFEAKYPNSKQYILSQGLTGRVEELSQRLNGIGLDDTTRLLLSTPAIYAALIEKAQTEDKVKSDDLEGLYSSVLRGVGDLPRRYFLARLLTAVLNEWRIQIKTSNRQWQQLDDQTLKRGIPIRAGQVEPAVQELLGLVYRVGDLPYYLDQYINQRSAIAKTAFTSAIRQAMLDYLVKLGVQIKSETIFKAGEYDEYFALAYNEALKQSTTADDPIDTARTKGGQVSWNFTIDSFDSVDAQGVIPENIKAAGVLDYLYYIGECMQVFNVTNALVLRWASGMLDIPEGKTAAALYRFHKLRNERNTSEERAMLYKRVLNKGNGRVLSNMVVNQSFPGLWYQLMQEVTDYIDKTEGSRWGAGWVSRAPLYQATKNLQYNLSEHMTGMAHVQVTEDYAHLQEALDILKSPEILGDFGGRRKNVWSVIEQIAKQDLGKTVPTANLRSLAVEGNKIFQWIATFEEGGVQEDAFTSFLGAAEAWIISQASVGDRTPSSRPARPRPPSNNGHTSERERFERDLKDVKAEFKAMRKEINDGFDDWEV